nr:winged helix-turn-helix domain-containing protein [Alloscardovia omnicolens]
SVDISSRGIDKAFAVSKIAQQFNISTSDIVFVGDRMSEGGNDYPAAVAGTHAVRVGGPDDTNDFMRSFMRAYTHGIMIDVVSRRVWVHDKEVAIADTEFSLLLALLHARGEVVSREDLLKQAWGYEDSGDTRLLSVSIARLRAVLEDNPQMPQRIQTVRGGGYRLVFA